MKKIISLLLLLILMGIYACAPKDPSQPDVDNITRGQVVLSKYVALGNSLTAGFQSGGMHEDFQAHSFPKLIAGQVGMGSLFQQPTILDPGIGSTSGMTPFYLDASGNIVSDSLVNVGVPNPLALLGNATLLRPYDNLGVPGATVHDLDHALDATTSQSGDNLFFNMILRNPDLKDMTQLDQAIFLGPTIVTLWIGNNDVLGSMMEGTDQLITNEASFKADYGAIVGRLGAETNAGIIIANLPYVTDIPYCNTGDLVFRVTPLSGVAEPVPVVFDASFQPVDFGGGLYVPLLTSETSVEHLILSGITEYKAGLGIPDSATLVSMSIPEAQAGAMVAGMVASGLNPTGQPLTGEFTLTADETTALKDAVDEFNTFIEGLCSSNGIPLVDANAMLTELNTSGIDGYSGKFLPVAAAMGMPSAFSLDGIHLSNGGAAIAANEFIKKINAAGGSSIPLINTAQYAGQYDLSGNGKVELSKKHIKQIEKIFK